MPRTANELTGLRRLLYEQADVKGLRLAALSRALDRNHAYLHQYLHRGTPRRLPYDILKRLARLLDLPLDALLAADQQPSKPISAAATPPIRPPQPGRASEPETFATRLARARLDSSHKTPIAFCTAAGIDRYRYADLEDGIEDPSLSELSAIAAVSGKSFEWLIRGPSAASTPAPLPMPTTWDGVADDGLPEQPGPQAGAAGHRRDNGEGDD
jgi:transcriptional regulator with XRE-family HTH domain